MLVIEFEPGIFRSAVQRGTLSYPPELNRLVEPAVFEQKDDQTVLDLGPPGLKFKIAALGHPTRADLMHDGKETMPGIVCMRHLNMVREDLEMSLDRLLRIVRALQRK